VRVKPAKGGEFRTQERNRGGEWRANEILKWQDRHFRRTGPGHKKGHYSPHFPGPFNGRMNTVFGPPPPISEITQTCANNPILSIEIFRNVKRRGRKLKRNEEFLQWFTVSSSSAVVCLQCRGLAQPKSAADRQRTAPTLPRSRSNRPGWQSSCNSF